jgi:hypothetical protein
MLRRKAGAKAYCDSVDHRPWDERWRACLVLALYAKDGLDQRAERAADQVPSRN